VSEALLDALALLPSSISRELRRAPGAGAHNAKLVHLQSGARRIAPRRLKKLHTRWGAVRSQTALFEGALVAPQIANMLRALWPDDSDKTVSRETIYNAIYLHPRGELKRELSACLCHHNQVPKPHSRAIDQLGQIKDMQSIHIRPPEIEDRLVPGHWEGDLIKGEGNRSSVGTLVERTTRFVVLVKMDNAGARSVVDSFSAVPNRQPAELRESMKYDQGRGMHSHKIRPNALVCRSTLPTRTALGSAGPTRTPTDCCAHICPTDRTCRSTPRTSSIPSRSRSTYAREKRLVGKLHSPSIPSIWLA
jgi:IS30 family transposase